MKENITLIGFMGSGKTTVGKKLAAALDMKYIDTDKEIELRSGKTIKEIFSTEGEEYFRGLERNLIAEISNKSNIVISPGGGIIIDNDNIKNLKRASYIIYLDCDFTLLCKRLANSNKRPLLQSKNQIENISKLYNKRKKLYEISADYTIKIQDGDSVYDVVEDIKRAYILS